VSAVRQPAAQFPRPTIAALAEALGVHRNSITAWSVAGAPAGPPYCELAWRTWAASQGKIVSRAPEQALLDLLAGAGVPEYRRQAEAQRGAAPPVAAGGEQQVLVGKDWDQENKRLQAEQRQLDLDKARRRVISIEDLHRLVEAIASAGASVLNDAPRLADALPLGPDDRQRVLASIEAQLAQRREQLVANLRTKLREFLEQAP
jgi:hypothetical protein